MCPSSTRASFQCVLSIFIIILGKSRHVFYSAFYFVAYITHFFQIIKCLLHVIAGRSIVLMHNSLNVQF